MKHLDGDWRALLTELEGWRALSIFARRALLDQVRPDQPVAAAPLAGHLDALRRNGWLVHEDGVRRIAPARRPLLEALIAMDRVPVFDDPVEPSLAAYLMMHFERREMAELLGRPAGTGSRRRAAAIVADPAWLGAFLDGDGAPAGEPAVEGDLRTLLGWLLERGEPLPLADRRALALPLDDARLAAALAAGLRRVLLLAALRPTDLEPVIGCWPPAAERARRARVVAPEPVVPHEVYDGLSGLVDLAAVLAACAAEPPRLRTDLELFKRAKETLALELTPLPPWLEPFLNPAAHPRLALMLATLESFDLVRIGGSPGQGACLVPTREGRAWLAMGDEARLRALIDRLRGAEEGGSPPLVPRVLGAVFVDEATLTARVTAPFEALEGGVFLPLEDFLQHQAQAHNPLPEWLEARARAFGGWGYGRPRQAEMESAWQRQLVRFLVERLLLLGGARMARGEDGRVAFALSAPGRYLLGAREDFALEASSRRPRILVQPNFEVVFLEPAPLLESRIGRLAERVDGIGGGGGGERVGVLFEITRASAQRAAASGLDAEAALALLADAVTEPVPDNVARALREWIERCRRVELYDALVVRCPDAATAARVLAAAGGRGRLLGDTVVELPEPAGEAKLVRALRRAGVFVDRSPDPASREPGKDWP